MISIEDRLNYYINNTKCIEKPPCVLHGYDEPIEIDVATYGEKYQSIHPRTEYPIDVSRYCSFSTKPHLWFQCGDSAYTGPEWPVMVKTRDTHNEKAGGIIGNFESIRHWGLAFRIKDMQWECKVPHIIWRGADTGYPHRLEFVKKFNGQYDVGFSQYVQDGRLRPNEYPDKYISGMTPVENMLKYKFLPVIDGNDKSSALGWVLASGSVPIMPKPRHNSWLCEPWLKSGVHYVGVKRDWSDLPQKIEFLRKNDDFAKQIANNGKEFMEQFRDKSREGVIEEKIIQYINGIQGTA
jgi:hypothetical protein